MNDLAEVISILRELNRTIWALGLQADTIGVEELYAKTKHSAIQQWGDTAERFIRRMELVEYASHRAGLLN